MDSPCRQCFCTQGDRKSQTYAAEWIDKIAGDYIDKFGSPGLQKVCQGLQSAWKHGTEETKPPAKKIKTCV